MNAAPAAAAGAAETPPSSSSSSARTSKEYEEEIKHLKAVLKKNNAKVKRLEIEIRTTRLLYDAITTSLVTTQTELVETQTRLYTMSKKQQRVLEHTKWLDEYKNGKANVSAKYINESLS